MITFAVIAKSGCRGETHRTRDHCLQVLSATVAGLAVAIPALFMYSYLASLHQDAVTNMETLHR